MHRTVRRRWPGKSPPVDDDKFSPMNHSSTTGQSYPWVRRGSTWGGAGKKEKPRCVHARIVDSRPVVTVCAYEEDRLGWVCPFASYYRQFACRMDRSPGVTGRWSANAGLAPSEMGLPFSVESSVRDKLCGWQKVSKKYRRGE